MSLHPTMTDAEVDYMINAVKEVAANAQEWSKEYFYDPHINDYVHNTFPRKSPEDYIDWFVI